MSPCPIKLKHVCGTAPRCSASSILSLRPRGAQSTGRYASITTGGSLGEDGWGGQPCRSQCLGGVHAKRQGASRKLHTTRVCGCTTVVAPGYGCLGSHVQQSDGAPGSMGAWGVPCPQVRPPTWLQRFAWSCSEVHLISSSLILRADVARPPLPLRAEGTRSKNTDARRRATARWAASHACCTRARRTT